MPKSHASFDYGYISVRKGPVFFPEPHNTHASYYQLHPTNHNKT